MKNPACNKPICNSKTYFAKLQVIQSHLLKKSLVKILDSMQSIEWFSYTTTIISSYLTVNYGDHSNNNFYSYWVNPR